MKQRISGLTVATALALCSVAEQSSAGTGSVNVSIHFDVAPADLLRAPAIVPAVVRTCESMSQSIARSWAGRAKSPTLDCLSAEAMPLILTSVNGPALVARP